MREMNTYDTGSGYLQARPLCFEDLMSAHYRKAYSFAYRLAGNQEDAEDLTQEAFLRVYRSFQHYDPSRPFERWLFRIITNLFVDSLRARPKQMPLSLDAPLEGNDGDTMFNEIPDAEADPARHVMREIMDERIQKALNILPPAFKKTVILTDIEGMSYDEASQILGCAVGTVRSRLHRARMMMRAYLTGKASSVRGSHMHPLPTAG
jgi:RNA polymerase sigma-70 factor (ECF subfamily)